MSTDAFVAYFSSHQEFLMHWKYLLLICVLVAEGTATMLVTGALMAAGIFEPIPTLLVCIASETIDGYIWYSVGWFFGAKPIDYFIKNSPGRKAFMELIRRHSDKRAGLVVLLVKMTYSVTNATLVLIGSLKYDFKKFSFFNLIGSIGWAFLLLTLGFYFGQAALAFLPVLRNIGVTVFFIIASIITLLLVKHFGDMFINRVRKV